MQHRKRRRTDFILLLVLAFGGAMLTFLLAVGTDSERIAGYWAVARLGSEGPADVTEVLDYDFGDRSRHGIFRDVPGLETRSGVRVSSPTAPAEFEIYQMPQEKRIQIGDPDREISGRHRYRIEYPISVRFEDERISWNAVGTNWPVSIREIELHLIAPFELEGARATKGEVGSWEAAELERVAPGHLLVRVDALNALEGVTISAQRGSALASSSVLPAAPEGVAEDPGSGPWLPSLTVAIAILLAVLLVTPFILRAGRENVWAGGGADAAFGPRSGESFMVRRVDHDELATMAATEFVRPKDLSAWQGGVLLKEGTASEHRVAWLLERAIGGELEIEGSGKDLKIKREGGRGETIDALDSMFGGRSEVELGSYDTQFAAGWAQLGNQLDAWHRESGLWDPAGEEQRSRVRRLALLGLLLALLVLFFATMQASRWGAAWLPGVALGGVLLGAVLTVFVRSHELRIRTPEGSGLWIQTESFRRFLHKSDAQHVEKAARLGYLREYSAWAVALGEVDSWTKAVRDAGIEPSVDSGHYHFTQIAPALSIATSASSTAPSSSSGGGGGGSFGGGGGGGSW